MNIEKLEFHEKVRLYLKGTEGINLSDNELKMYKQCEQVAIWIKEDGIDDALKMCISDLHVSVKVAKKIMQNAIIIYGNNNILTKDFLVTVAYNDLRQTRRIALATGDAKIIAACDKNLLSFIDKHYGDNEVPQFDKIQPPTTMIVYDTELLGIEQPSKQEVYKILKLLMKPKRSKKEEQDFEDIEAIEEDE